MSRIIRIFVSAWLVFIANVPLATAQESSGVTKEWVQQFRGKGFDDDRLTAMTTDGAGNVYVTGATPPLSGNIEDLITIKYSPLGVELWRAIYRGTDSDYGTAIAVDSSGQVYVAGYSRGPVDGDFFTIKYSSSGDTLWTRRYLSPVPGYDTPRAILVDPSGNIWVTGDLGTSFEGVDIATIVYDASGTLQAEMIYNGAGNGDDAPTAMAVDPSGNVYVVGSVRTGAFYSTDNLLVIKYDAVASELWVRQYNGPGNDHDAASAVAVDAVGNVYVTGLAAAASYNTDYVTIKYSSAGDSLWVRRFDGPTGSYDDARSVAVDGTGNVFVTGRVTGSGSGNDVLTIKYTSTGDTVWTRTFLGAGTASDVGKSISVDASGNAFVGATSYAVATGLDITLLSYGSGGALQWQYSYNDTLVNADDLVVARTNSGGVTTLAGMTQTFVSSNDFVVLSISSGGSQAWRAKYASPGTGADVGVGLVVDASGNIITVGTGFYASGYGNIVTIKRLPTGDTSWVRRYSYNGSGDQGIAVAVDRWNNVLTLGTSWTWNGNTSADFTLIKYSPTGTKLWEQHYDGGNADYPSALVIDSSGSVFVVGTTFTSAWVGSYVTIKYDSAGVRKWFPKTYTGGGYNQGYAIALDRSGNTYVTGYSATNTGGTWPSSSDMATVKYNASGVQQWVQRFNGPSSQYDEGLAVETNESGSIYVAGNVNRGSSLDYVVVKYTPAGDTVWTAWYDSPTHQLDLLNVMKLDGSGNIYVAGGSVSGPPDYDYDFATVKFDSNGAQLWSARYDAGGTHQSDLVSSIAIGAYGNVYVSGSNRPNGTNSGLSGTDIATLRYSPSGTLEWSAIFDGSGHGYDNGSAMAIDTAENVYVLGTTDEGASGSDITTVRYTQTLALPVEVVQVAAAVNGRSVELRWTTASEIDNDGFEIERRSIASGPSPGVVWQKLAFVAGAGTAVSPTEYRYLDTRPLQGHSAYRLKQLDRNGGFRYLPEVEVISGSVPTAFALSQNYPNPFNPETKIGYALPTAGSVRLSVYDVLGRELLVLVDGEKPAGIHEAVFKSQDAGVSLTSGVYFYTLEVRDAKHEGTVWRETRKMLLMK